MMENPNHHIILTDPSHAHSVPCNSGYSSISSAMPGYSSLSPSMPGCSSSILISQPIHESMAPLNMRPPDTAHRRHISPSFHAPGRPRAYSSLSSNGFGSNSFAVSTLRSGQQHLDIKINPGLENPSPHQLNQYQHPIGFRHSSRSLNDEDILSHHLYQCQKVQLEESRAKIEELEKQLTLVLDSHRMVEQTSLDLQNENLVMRGVNYGLTQFVDGKRECDKPDNKERMELEIEKRFIQLENRLKMVNESKIAQLEAEIGDLKRKTCYDNLKDNRCNTNLDQVEDDKNHLKLEISKQTEKINYILKQATFLSKQIDSTSESVTFALQQINHNKMTINEDSERIDFVVRFMADVLWSEENEEKEQLESYTGLISPLLETSDEGETDNFNVDVDRNGNSETQHCKSRSTRKSHNICGYFKSNHKPKSCPPETAADDTYTIMESIYEDSNEDYDDIEEDDMLDVSITTPQLQSRAAIQEFLHTGHISDTPAPGSPGRFASRMKTGKPVQTKVEQSLADELAGFM